MATKGKILGPLPSHVFTYLGPVAVVFIPDLKTRDGEAALGIWDGEQRIIKIREGMPIAVQWQTLRHEQIHQVFWDAGLTESLATPLEEQICDLLATARVAEFMAELA